jgi:carbonic anhydrase
VNGKSFEMVAHLVHRAEDGRLAVVAVLLEKGSEHPLIQTVWNNLPLEKEEYVRPPELASTSRSCCPTDRSYYTYMGSLTTPPCSEGCALAGAQATAADLGRATGDLLPPLPVTMPARSSPASAA